MKKLKKLKLKPQMTPTHEGAAAYAYAKNQPLTHLTFTMGSALITDSYYESEGDQVFGLYDALEAVLEVEPKFAWQYGAWMRDPKNGKGNRVQGSLVPAMLDSLVGESEFTEDYVAACLSHRPDDVVAFFMHFDRLGLDAPTKAARRGMARALCAFDEYQLTKYAMQTADVRLCDVVYWLRPELDAMGDEADLVLYVATYLHAPSRNRAELAERLKLTGARKALWQKPKSYALDDQFVKDVANARVTWEQVFGHFGTKEAKEFRVAKQNRRVWEALLNTRGLMGDLAFMRNLRGFIRDDVPMRALVRMAQIRRFDKVWPYQVFVADKAAPQARPVLNEIFAKTAAKLPNGKHLGIADVSGSMGVKVGGAKSSATAMDVALCFTALMSETSGLGASFCDESMMRWSGEGKQYLYMAERARKQSALDFAQSPALRRGWGGTQVFGAVMELITWLRAKGGKIEAPDCLWFFSDMQFHPAAGGGDAIPKDLLKLARKLGVEVNVPPLEAALNIYRAAIGPVDVVLWNLAAYTPVPVPADMEGVLLVSGFDANTFKQVETWRSGKLGQKTQRVSDNQEAVLNAVRAF